MHHNGLARPEPQRLHTRPLRRTRALPPPPGNLTGWVSTPPAEEMPEPRPQPLDPATLWLARAIRRALRLAWVALVLACAVGPTIALVAWT